jgi:hypothetical protein
MAFVVVVGVVGVVVVGVVVVGVVFSGCCFSARHEIATLPLHVVWFYVSTTSSVLYASLL